MDSVITKGDFELNKCEESDVSLAERNTHVDNILRILRETINKIRISIVVPHLIENPYALNKYINDDEKCKEGQKLILDCLKNMVRKQFRNVTNEENIFGTLIQKTNLKQVDWKEQRDLLMTHDTVRLIDFFHQNYSIINVPEKWLENMNGNDRMLLESMETLYVICEERLRRSAIEELRRDQEVRQLNHQNEILTAEIDDMERKLQEEHTKSTWKRVTKEAVGYKFDEDLSYKKWDNSIKVKKEIFKSSQRVRQLHNATIQRQKELEEELERSKTVYETLLKKNLEQEKEARAEKNKLLLQLESLLKKYDTVIGEKMKESMQLTEEYDQKKKEFDEFMIEFRREEEQYTRIVLDREAEEKRIFEENLALFIMNRAARIIQRAWRAYWREQKKLMKKNKKGGKKGKKNKLSKLNK